MSKLNQEIGEAFALVHSTDGVVLALHELVAAHDPVVGPTLQPPSSASGSQSISNAPTSKANPSADQPAQDLEDEPLCLIAHATGFHGRCYRLLAEELSPRHRPPRILAPDLRGHGDSTPPQDGRYSWEGFAEDLLSVLDSLGHPPTRGIGHSMGGASLLRAEQLRPGTFEHLFLYEPIVFPPDLGRSGSDSPLVGAAERRRSRFPSTEDAIARFASKPPLDVLDDRCLRDYVEYGFRTLHPERPEEGIELKLPGAHEADVYRMSTAHDTWSQLPEVTTPVVVARGTGAPGGPVEIAPQLVERLPDARLVDFAELGHFGPLQDPSAVAGAVLASWDAR